MSVNHNCIESLNMCVEEREKGKGKSLLQEKLSVAGQVSQYLYWYQ